MYNPFYPPIMSRQALGSLIVDVTTNPLTGPITPIPNALVTVREFSPLGNVSIIAEFSTNEVGQTPPLELPSPPEELSLEPGASEKPYATYSVEASSDSFVTTLVKGTQIFSNIRSIQPIRLTPTRSLMQQTRQEIDTIIIGPATLFGNFPPKIPESEIKDVNQPGFVTLDAVIVPEIIIVHGGSPTNTNAPNYTVRYRDYIKNVASSEIYPTWTRETIRANVIAIISFTLNRVYTEWYRNKGKNFTITNSTAFDHAFFFGRDIFDTISEVVDEVFDTYIKRTGVVQPLLTQYCDGAKVQCPGWMAQWGSQSLGQDGLDAKEILRYYYGQDILFPTAPQVAGNPESFPGQPLSQGDSGSNVRKIQEQLNRISNNYPLIPKIATDGVFGSSTAEAVKTFQQIFHLPITGIVDRATWYKISEIYVAVTRIAELLP